MANLYLNFIENKEKGSSNWNDYYTASLAEQYEKQKKKLGGYAIDSLQNFLQGIFPPKVSRNYYISMPGFERKNEKIIEKEIVFTILSFALKTIE